MRARVVAAVALIVFCLAVPTALAAGFFPDPHSDIQLQWQDLFTQVFWAALLVFVLVEGLLLYALLRFRRRKDGPQEGPRIHGNTKMEIAWTIAPTLVMAWLLVVSLNALAITDSAPQPDVEIKVTGSRFLWRFEYPDGTRVSNDLHVEQGKLVRLTIESTDVIHAFNVPSLGVMIDAVPGHTNFAWFRANEAGDYHAQCRELCGAGHGLMRATVKVFPSGASNRSYGDPAAPAPTTPPPSAGNQTNGTAMQIALGPGFTINPGQNTALPGQTLAIEVTNMDAGVPHNLYIGPMRNEGQTDRGAVWKTQDLGAGETETLIVTLPAEPGYWTIWCDVSGHFGLGMKGSLSSGGSAPLDAGGPTPLLPGFEVPLLVGALVVAGIAIRRRASR